MPTSRRQFLTSTGTATSAVVAAPLLQPLFASSSKPGTINLGIIGCGGIMTHHVKGIVARSENVNLTWLCDIDPAQIAKISKHVDGFQSQAPQQTGRYEDVIQDSNVDAVIIATPHHWHAPMTIQAMQEGKDVYIEKPISHVYNEGHAIIAASKKYGRVVQQGSQMRNSAVTKKAEKLLQSGLIGEVKVAKAWTAETRSVVKPVPDGIAPGSVDYDRWLGPAPKRPFNRHRFHGTWRMFTDYGNGEIGDDGIHDLDMAAWGLGVDSVPSEITARGGRMMLDGHASDYPDNMVVSFEYPDGRLLVYENYPFTAYGIHGFDNGNVFYGTDGYMIFSRRGAFSTFLGPKGRPGPTEGRDIRGQRGYAEHMAEFLSAVRNRNLNTKARAEVAHRSCSLVHFGEIAFRTKGRLTFDAKTEQFVDCDEANELLTKKYRGPYALPSV
ncbi:MAG: Gfo/Idh/MocA family oxidoreductase [Planctomycetaceae bacterium]